VRALLQQSRATLQEEWFAIFASRIHTPLAEFRHSNPNEDEKRARPWDVNRDGAAPHLQLETERLTSRIWKFNIKNLHIQILKKLNDLFGLRCRKALLATAWHLPVDSSDA